MVEQLPSDIEALLKEQHLELVEILQYPNTPRRRFFSFWVKPSYTIPPRSESSDLVLKIFGRGDSSVISGFEKEVEFLRLATEFGSAGIKKHVPRFISQGRLPRPWYLREYIKGDFLGDICFDFGIKKEFLDSILMGEFLRFFCNLLEFSKSISETDFCASLSSHDYDWYKNDFRYYREYIKSVSQENFRFIGGILEESRDLLNREARVLVHGDLYLKNMFWSHSAKASVLDSAVRGSDPFDVCSGSSRTKLRGEEPSGSRREGRVFAQTRRAGKSGGMSKGQLMVSDWELLHLGNLAFDLGFIWAISFRNDAWRTQLIRGFENTAPDGSGRAFRDLFKIVVISTSLRFIRHSEIMLDHILSESCEEARENASEALSFHRQALSQALFDKRFPF